MKCYTRLRIRSLEDPRLSAMGNALIVSDVIQDYFDYHMRYKVEIEIISLRERTSVVDMRVTLPTSRNRIHAWWLRYNLRKTVKRYKHAKAVEILWEL